MRLSSPASALPILVVLSIALCGCAKTGLAWVNEPPSGGFNKRDAELAAAMERAEIPPQNPAAEPPAEEPATRSFKTLSLGQSVTINDQPPPQTAQGPLVIRTQSYYRPISYGFVEAIEAIEPILVDQPILVDPDPIVVQQNPPAGVQPGESFPPPTSFGSFGPPFPFRAAPADPFAP
jgi:hypothetical protein